MENTPNSYLTDRQMIAFFGRSSPAEKQLVENIWWVFRFIPVCDGISKERLMKQFGELCKSACAFHCDKNCRLFVTVVQSEGIFIRFPGPPSRFSFRYCHSGTAIQTRGTVAGIYGEATEKLYERHYLVIKIVSSFFCLSDKVFVSLSIDLQ